MTRNPNMREAILSAAELLFSTRGFNAVSIRDIALEAGANPGSITYHFKSKECLPHLPRMTIVWRSQFLLGALYYTLVNPERVTRLSRGEADGADMAEAIEQLVSATVASMQASDIDHVERGLDAASPRAKLVQ